MAKLMQWRRKDVHGGVELYIADDGKTWKYYTQSIISTPDSTLPGASRGFTTLQKGLKCGYTLLDLEGKPVN